MPIHSRYTSNGSDCVWGKSLKFGTSSSPSEWTLSTIRVMLDASVSTPFLQSSLLPSTEYQSCPVILSKGYSNKYCNQILSTAALINSNPFSDWDSIALWMSFLSDSLEHNALFESTGHLIFAINILMKISILYTNISNEWTQFHILFQSLRFIHLKYTHSKHW